MKVLQLVRLILFNRYVLAAVAFGIWIVFFDKNDFFTQRHRASDLKELNEKIDYYKLQIDSTEKELQALQTDPATLEKYAREKYYMKRSNEDIYLIELPAATTE